MLGGLCLVVAHIVLGDKGHMHESDIALWQFADKLPYSLKERHALDIADRSADLDKTDIRFPAVLGVGFGGVLYAALYFIGDMRNYLHGAAQIIAVPLLLDDGLVDLARRYAVL